MEAAPQALPAIPEGPEPDPRARLRRSLRLFASRLPILLLGFAVGYSAGYAYATRQPSTYQAEASIIVGQSLRSSNPGYDQLLASQAITNTYASVATSRPVLLRVADRLANGDTAEDLARSVSVGVDAATSLLSITARADDPYRAAAIANALADELVASSPTVSGRDTLVQRQVTANVATVQRQIRSTQVRVDRLTLLPGRTAAEADELSGLRTQLVSLRDTYVKLLALVVDSGSNSLSIVSDAVPPSSASGPRPLLIAMLVAFLGLLVAIALAFGPRLFDDTLRDPNEVAPTTGLPTLGVLKARGRRLRRLRPSDLLPTLTEPRSAGAEAVRSVRWRVEFAMRDRPFSSLLVTSAEVAEGKTVTAANLAVAFAQSGRRVLLVDADFRDPHLHRLFNIANGSGLANVVRNDVLTSDIAVAIPGQPRLRVLPAGPLPVNPSEFLGSDRMRDVLEQLATEFDLVILDSPSLSIASDALALSAHAAATLMVVDMERSHRAAVRRARALLAEAGADVLGTVLIRLPRRAYKPYRQRRETEAVRQGAAVVKGSAGASTSPAS
jgi:polysaccharide biosynthesis transport protein